MRNDNSIIRFSNSLVLNVYITKQYKMESELQICMMKSLNP